MEFRYRYVDFGTRFVACPGLRAEPPQGATAATVREQAACLYENELALDVGGVCLGYQDETLAVIDHHFYRPIGQFPSACAAVLHQAERIVKHFSELTGPIWLVTHRDPDFDAFASMYLARGLLQVKQPNSQFSIEAGGWSALGIQADGWRSGGAGTKEIDWFRPFTASLSAERRWPILLAAFASCVDNCKPTSCPKNRTLDSVLYAAMLRGRNYLPTGAIEFFDEVRERLCQDAVVNPQLDSVLENTAIFGHELDLLDRELQAYQRDLRRSRRAMVFVQQAREPFDAWYAKAVAQPLVDERGHLNKTHLRPAADSLAQLDAVMLRDPECLLFKTWARLDREQSSQGQGFAFTAIAYSGERETAEHNRTNYYVALDPERAASDGLHLYNVWARLQSAEITQLRQSGNAAALTDAVCRHGYERRADDSGHLWSDPWYDGANYACTIIGTPGRGTTLAPPGAQVDLSDDPVMRLVLDEVLGAALPAQVQVVELPLDGRATVATLHDSVQAALLQLEKVPHECYRFARLELEEGIDPTRGVAGQQIGQLLWQLLDVGRSGVPTDFVERHLLLTQDSVGVWSRAGVVFAAKKREAATAAQLEEKFRELVAIATAVGQLSRANAADEAALRTAVESSDKIAQRALRLQQYLTFPEGRLLRRFYEATSLNEFLSAAREIHTTSSNALTAQRLDANVGYVAGVQNAVEWLEIFIVSFYAVELTHVLGGVFGFEEPYAGIGTVVIGATTAISVALGLRPWAHGHGGDHKPHGMHPLARALLIMAVMITLFVAIGVALKHGGTDAAADKTTTSGQQADQAKPAKKGH